MRSPHLLDFFSPTWPEAFLIITNVPPTAFAPSHTAAERKYQAYRHIHHSGIRPPVHTGLTSLFMLDCTRCTFQSRFAPPIAINPFLN